MRTHQDKLAYGREWAKTNAEWIKERNKKYYDANSNLYLYVSARKRARKFAIEFSIEASDIIVPDECPVLGVPFQKRTHYAASLDRIDPTKGYIKGNIQVISRKANRMKSDASREELENFANWILNEHNRLHS